MAAQIGTAVDVFETATEQQIADDFGLIIAVFEHQPTMAGRNLSVVIRKK